MIPGRLQKLVNFDAAIAVVMFTLRASYRGCWNLLCFASILDITQIADGDGIPHLQPSLKVQEVFHEEVFRDIIYSSFWNDELFSTHRTRHAVSGVLILCRFCSAFQAVETECVNTWQNSWIIECIRADWTICYFPQLLLNIRNRDRHLN